MGKIIAIAFTIIITSFYFFPFETTYLPAANTKMILAGIGLIWFLFNIARKGESRMDKDFVLLSMVAIFVSIIAFISTTINTTSDYTYATYIVSMWVWMGGAYTVVNMIQLVHKRINVELACNYLIAVCALQCIIAFTMNQYAPLKDFVDGFLASEGFMGKVEDRMYGIGASLDVAGMRFAAILIMISFCILNSKKILPIWELVFHILSFLIISVIGNMIGRTTIVGVAIAITYMIYASFFARSNRFVDENVKIIWPWLLSACFIFIPIVIFLYNTNLTIHDNLRFAFEGFFSLAEKGHWETNSNNILQNMIVFPDNLKTWLIGDGYIENPRDDPYFIGTLTGGYYMNTDIGYCRFIFYFGLIGLITFIIFMAMAGYFCMKRSHEYKFMFFMLLTLNYIIWIKVSSDLFLIFALFLCIPYNEEQEEEETEDKLEFANKHVYTKK